MHRIDTATAQKDKFGAGKNGFTRGNPQTGTPATDLDDDYFDMIQEELCRVVEESGEELDKGKHDQLLTALRALLLSRSNPFGDIASDGPEAIATALVNLRLGAGAPAIGIPFFWPLAAMPNTVMDEWSDMVFLKPNGASFSAATYPKLAKVWTGLVIPDMRGEFPRIWDDGRGVDAGRALLSIQLDALQNITGSFSAATAGASQLSVLVNGGAGAFYPGSQKTAPPSATATTGNDRVSTMYFDADRVARTSTETRSRNIALNFLVRAK
ncbi:TPA: tail fiber protein [Citrobacter amalonaticus]|nr:tail fiber protein [Citrobacter amalonaticus]